MNIRLSSFEIQTIIHGFKEHFLKEDHLWLFGSRANPSARGGDIDLYIETSLDEDKALDQKMTFVIELYHKIGDQKIDIVLNCLHAKYEIPIFKIAKEEGIQLV